MTYAPVPTTLQAAAILSAAPQIAPPASLPGASQTGIPNQKAVIATLGGLLTYIIVAALQKYAGITVPPELVSGAVAVLLALFVPPSQRDVVNNMTDANVHAAMRDPATQVSYVQTPVTPPTGEAAVIVPPATKAA